MGSRAASQSHVVVGRSASTPSQGRRRHIPSSIPKSQAYYWKHARQDGEQESLRELAAGEAVEFSNARDMIRWLLSEDD